MTRWKKAAQDPLNQTQEDCKQFRRSLKDQQELIRKKERKKERKGCKCNCSFLLSSSIQNLKTLEI